jgi:hypothetical protein
MDPCGDVGSGEAVGTGGQGNDRFGDPSHARLVEVDPADDDLADAGRGWQTLKRLIGDEARADAAQSVGKSFQHSLEAEMISGNFPAHDRNQVAACMGDPLDAERAFAFGVDLESQAPQLSLKIVSSYAGLSTATSHSAARFLREGDGAAVPRGMTQTQGIDLARDFAHAEFVDQGMIADLNVHWERAEDGTPKPDAHVMLTMRSVDENGFGPKVREWNRSVMVGRWRERWAELANERLAELDIDARIDHRSLGAQGIALEPQSQIGAPAQRIESEGIEGADRAEMHSEIARNNGARIIADPSIALDAITHRQIDVHAP